MVIKGPQCMGARRGGARIGDHLPPLENPSFYCYLGAFLLPFYPFGGLYATFLIFMWGLFYHAVCGDLLAIFISMHMGSFSDFFSMWGPFMLLFFIVGGGFLCSYGGLFWGCPPPYKRLYGRQCPGCPNEEKNVAKRPPHREK